MNRAAAVAQESALGVTRHTEAAEVRGAVDEAALELSGCEVQERGGAEDVIFGEVDVAGLLTAGGASGLTFEAHLRLNDSKQEASESSRRTNRIGCGTRWEQERDRIKPIRRDDVTGKGRGQTHQILTRGDTCGGI